MLRRWSTNGYKYFETDEDKAKNDKVNAIDKFEFTDVMSTTYGKDSSLRGAPLHDGTQNGIGNPLMYITINN
jgi:hypothetical protein